MSEQQAKPEVHYAKMTHDMRVKFNGVTTTLEQIAKVASSNQQTVFQHGGMIQVEGSQEWLRGMADRLEFLAADCRGIVRGIDELEPYQPKSLD